MIRVSPKFSKGTDLTEIALTGSSCRIKIESWHLLPVVGGELQPVQIATPNHRPPANITCYAERFPLAGFQGLVIRPRLAFETPLAADHSEVIQISTVNWRVASTVAMWRRWRSPHRARWSDGVARYDRQNDAFDRLIPLHLAVATGVFARKHTRMRTLSQNAARIPVTHTLDHPEEGGLHLAAQFAKA